VEGGELRHVKPNQGTHSIQTESGGRNGVYQGREKKIAAEFAPAAGRPENTENRGFWTSIWPFQAEKAGNTRSSSSTASEKHRIVQD
jgi:hypothetical protein